MSENTFEQRMTAAEARLRGLAAALEAGGPWPLATRFDHSTEAAWGPRETLAHIEEMLSFWLGETERILEDGDGGPAVFGRQATDEVRLAIIARDRTLPIRELVARVDAAVGRWRQRWVELDAASRRRNGTHVTRGEMTIDALVDRFVIGHLEEHLDQLAEAAGGGSTAA
jgi:DinB superfamily